MGVSEKSETSILLCTGKLFPLLEHWADLQFIPNKKNLPRYFNSKLFCVVNLILRFPDGWFHRLMIVILQKGPRLAQLPFPVRLTAPW